MARIRLFQELPDPTPDVDNFREGVLRDLAACVELRVADAESEIVNVLVWDNVVEGWRDWRVDEELEKLFAR